MAVGFIAGDFATGDDIPARREKRDLRNPGREVRAVWRFDAGGRSISRGRNLDGPEMKSGQANIAAADAVRVVGGVLPAGRGKSCCIQSADVVQ